MALTGTRWSARQAAVIESGTWVPVVAGIIAVVVVAVVLRPLTFARRPATAPASFAAVVARLEAFVEHDRGLAFIRPPTVASLAGADFDARLAAADPIDRSGGVSPTLEALGLAEPVTDQRTSVSPPAPVVAGFFESRSETVFVRAGEDAPYRRYVLVHELTHALQAQQFGLRYPDGDIDRTLAAMGLFEGDAKRVADDYLHTLSVSEATGVQIDALNSGDELYRAEHHLSVGSFPYLVGRDFVRYLLAHKGQAGLDAAFRAVPTSTEQLIHPDRYLAGDDPKSVTSPAADGQVVDRGTMGQFALIMVLAHDARASGAIDAVQGWAGGSYVTWRSANRVCTRATVVMDRPDQATRLRTALTRWASKGNRQIIPARAASDVELTACSAP
jgi:hypothetical protein